MSAIVEAWSSIYVQMETRYRFKIVIAGDVFREPTRERRRQWLEPLRQYQ